MIGMELTGIQRLWTILVRILGRIMIAARYRVISARRYIDEWFAALTDWGKLAVCPLLRLLFDRQCSPLVCLRWFLQVKVVDLAFHSVVAHVTLPASLTKLSLSHVADEAFVPGGMQCVRK